MTSNFSASKTWGRLSKAKFEIGGEDQLAALNREFPAEPPDDPTKARLETAWKEFTKSTGIRIGTLLKSDNISFLFGAGASKEAGGILLGNVPKEIESKLLAGGIKGETVSGWLKLFYEAVRSLTPGQMKESVTDGWVQQRLNDFATAKPLAVNYEQVLACLYRWRAVLSGDGDSFQLGPEPGIKISASDLKSAIKEAKDGLISVCDLPAQKDDPNNLNVHKEFLKKVLTRPLNLKRANIFSLNYDTMLEQAADAEGIVLVDGFIGTICRTFRPESFDQDLYFPAETTEGRVHRLERVLHLYKLHGSVNWVSQEPTWNNPYGISSSQAAKQSDDSILIYPTPSKYGEVLGMPYAEIFRRFAASVVRRQSTLFVIGYGFGDEHVNAIIRQALAIPSFSLIIVDPFAPSAGSNSGFVASLRSQNDRRVWVVSGESLGIFSQFVEALLPDLRDEEILGKVMKTYKSLGGADDPRASPASENAE